MQKRTFLLVLVCIFSMECLAQHPILTNWHLGFSYYGNNLWNPGLQVTGQKLVFERTIKKMQSNEKLKVKHQQVCFDASLGFYYDNPTHWTIHNSYEVLYRRVRKKGKYRSIGLGGGYLRTLLPETYRVDPQGQVSKVSLPGEWYGAPVISLGIGRLWKRSGTNPWRLQIHGKLLLNYNNSTSPMLNVEYGYLLGYKSKEDESK